MGKLTSGEIGAHGGTQNTGDMVPIGTEVGSEGWVFFSPRRNDSFAGDRGWSGYSKDERGNRIGSRCRLYAEMNERLGMRDLSDDNVQDNIYLCRVVGVNIEDSSRRVIILDVRQTSPSPVMQRIRPSHVTTPSNVESLVAA